MSRATSRRNAVTVAALTLATFALGVTTAVFVAGSASAALPTTSATTTTTTATTAGTPTPGSPEARYLVVNGTANAASAHVIGGSSAFPNFKTGAVDNYYSMAHSHVDNSPFAQGTASPFDTGPVGQTAAAGNFQQPQYADARWPGDTGKATYGKQGEPYAAASASEYRATAEASEAAHGLAGPSGPSTPAVPKELDDRLRQALAAWTAIWDDRLAPKEPAAAVPTPKPTVTIPNAPVGGAKAKPPVPVPSPTVPSAPVPSPPVPAPPAPPVPTPPVPSPTLPSGSSSAPSRSLASASAPRDGVFLLESSTLATVDPKSKALVTSGESSLGRVSLGGGQIVIEDIQVSASITNDGSSPTHKAAVSVGAASIGGVPVTIDQDGVHIAGQRQGLPYEQASTALNNALKQAGIRLFLVAPEITTNSCDETGTGTTTTSSDQSDPSTTGSSCEEGFPPTTTASACEQPGTGTGTTTTTTTTPVPIPTPTPTTTSSDQSDGTATTSSCEEGFAPTTTSSPCAQAGTATGTTTTSSDQQGTTTTAGSSDQTGTANSGGSSGGMTISATGVHVVFTQPPPPSGVPAQHAEYVLGEVFLDSLAVPAGPLPDLDLSTSSLSSSSSSCPGGSDAPGTASGGALTGGGSALAGGSASSGVLSPVASAFGSTSQPSSSSSSTGNSLPAAFAAALKKPLWLLLAYVLWQAIVIGTGVSVWNWRRGEAS